MSYEEQLYDKGFLYAFDMANGFTYIGRATDLMSTHITIRDFLTVRTSLVMRSKDGRGRKNTLLELYNIFQKARSKSAELNQHQVILKHSLEEKIEKP